MGQLKYLFLLVLFSSGIFSQNQDWLYRNPLPQNDLFAVKFLNPATGYVCGTNGIILKTVTGDNQWINQSLGTSRSVYGLYFFDANTGVAVGDSGLLVRTINGGTTWVTVPAGLTAALRSVTFVNSSTGFAVGDGIVIKSTNGGVNWAVNYNAAQSLRSVFFLDNNTGFAVGVNGLLIRTTNSGLSWNTQSFCTDTLKCICFSNSVNGFIAASSGVIYKSTDSGLNWGTQYFALGGWNTVKFLNQSVGYAAGKIIMLTIDGGVNWTPVPIGNYLSFFNDVCPVDTFLFTCSGKGYVLKIYDNTFFDTKINIGGSCHTLSSMSFTDQNTGCIISDDEYLRTSNGGLNWYIDMPLWTSFNEGGANFTDVVFFSPSSAYRIYDLLVPTMFHEDFLEHSTDGGLTWNGPNHFTQIAAVINGICEVWGTAYITIGYGGIGGPSPAILKNSGSGWTNVYSSGNIQFDKISFADDNTGMAIFATPNYGFTRTTNGGAYWLTSLSFFSKRPLNVQMLSSGIGYVIGDSSLFERTTDFGASWTQVSGNLQKCFIKLQFINNNTGWIITQDYVLPTINRLYYTSSGGSNFWPVQSLDNFNVRGMSFINAYTGYVCGDGGTILRTTNGGLTFTEPIAVNAPKSYSLSQNYPNPFNPISKIKYQIPKSSDVKLMIFDILGREITVLVNQKQLAGTYEVSWDASGYPSGVYIYKLVVSPALSGINSARPLKGAADFTETGKMVLLK